MIALAISVCLLAPLQEKKAETAADFLDRVEKKHLDGDHFAWEGTVTAEDARNEGKLTYKLRLAKGGRLRADIRAEMDGRTHEAAFVVSDGRFYVDDGRGGRVRKIDADEIARMREAIVRAGMTTPMMLVRAGPGGQGDFGVMLQNPEFREDETLDDRRCRVVAYELKLADTMTLAVTAWIDAETLVFRKRVLRLGDKQSVTEVTTRASFDEKVDDATFEIPKDAPEEAPAEPDEAPPRPVPVPPRKP